MSIINREASVESGLKKIRWASSYMPAMNALRRRLEKDKPFAGLKITMSIHLEAKTAYLAVCLNAGGAQVYVTGCNPLSTQDDVAAALDSLGIETFGVRGVDDEEYKNLLLGALSHHPNLIIDDGGDLVALLHSGHEDLADELIGGCEETTTGVHRLHARAAAGQLNFPMVNVNDAKCKHYYDNKYGTGQSVWDALMHLTNLLVAGKTVVVAGYGYCGRGIAMRAKGMGADVIVTEIDPFKALEATMENFRVMTMDEAAPLGDIFVTSTGCCDVITKRHFEVMKDGVLLSNAGHFDVEVDGRALAELAVKREIVRDEIEAFTMPDGRRLMLLAEGRLVNLAGGNGHPAEIMDMSFAVQTLSLLWMLENGKKLAPGVYEVTEETDNEVARLRLEAGHLRIDTLTDRQREYLAGWEVE